MTFDDDPFADLIPSRQDDDPFADLIPQAGLTNPQGVSAGDYGRAVMAGGGQLFSGAGWLASKVPGLEGAGQGMQRLGQQASDFWVKGDPNAPLLGEGMSPAARAEQGKDFIKKTDDGSGFFGYEWGDASPHTAGLSAAQSLLGTAAGMGVGGALAKGLQVAGLGARTAGVIGYGAGEAGVASGSAGHETYRSIMAMPVEKLEIHPEFQELLKQPGSNRNTVKEQIANLAANQSAATTAGTTFALSAPMGALIGKIMAGVPIATTKPRAIGTAAAGEAGQEFLQSGAEQMAQNKAVQDYADQSRGIGEGVLNAAVGGAAAGGIMGGGLGFSAVTEVQGERDAIDSIKGIAENFAFDQISDEQLDNAIQTGHELHQKYKDAELKSALDALAAEQILRSADKIVPPGQQTAQQGPQAVPAEQIIGPEDDVAADPNALPQEPPGFFGPTAGLTMPGMQPPVQTTPPPETTGYGFTGQAPESFDPFADLVPQQEGSTPAITPAEPLPNEIGSDNTDINQSVKNDDLAGLTAVGPAVDPAILRQQKAKANYQKAAKIDERSDPLGVIIAKLGGVNSDEAEQNGFDKESFRGYGWKIKRVFNKNGDSLDGMRERLNGYGFDFPDVNSLIDALQEDMAGNRKYTPAGYETLMEKQALEPEREAEPEQPGINGQYDVPLDEYTGDMYEDADANEPEYNPNWGEEAKQLYELLEEASAIDKQAAKDIWESGRDERDVAVALYDFIRDNESGAQGDRGEGEAQQGTGAQAEAPGTAETTATEGVTPNDDQQRVAGLSRPPAETVTREPVSPGAELADTDTRKDQVQVDVPAVSADLLGDDTRTAQSVADAKIQKDKKPAEEPALVQSGDELFANNGKLEPDLFDAAAHEAATSPKNDTPQPTEAQIEAGNLVKMRQDTRSTEDGSFSINPPAITLPIIPHDAVERIVAKVRFRFAAPNLKITVVRAESALPQEVQDRAKKDKATGHVKAVYHKGSIYLVSPQFHSRLEVEEALAHELSGHYGGRILFDKDLQAAYQRLYFSLGLKGVKEIAKKNGIDMAHYFKTASEMPAVERPFYLVDELLAHMQGERVYDSLPDRVKRLIQEFWGAVRDRLRGLGFTGLSEYSDSDLALLLKRMRQAAKEGVIAEQNGEPVFVMASDDRTAFSRGNPGRASDTLKRKFGLKPKQGGIRKFIDRMRNTPWGDLKRHLSDEWTQGALDRFYGIKRAEQEYSGPLNAGQSGYIATRLSTGLSSIITATLHYGTPRWSQGILQKIPDSKGLLEVLGPVQEDINDWLVWMGSKRASRLLGEGRENNLTPAEIQEGLDLATGREVLFQQVADDYAEFMGKILDVAEGAGLIDPAGRAMWEHADYVPFYRMTLDEFTTGPKGRKGISHQTAGIRRLRGADAATNDLLENIIMNVTHLIDASMKNNALRKTIRNLAGTGLYEDASMEFKAELIPMSQVKRRVKDGLAAQGWDQMSIEQYIDMMPKTAIDGLQKMWAMKAPADADIVRVMVGGKAKYYRVFDHLLLRALTQINTDKMGGIVNVMRSFKRILTAGVTASPEFMARNFIRDAAHAWAINEDGFTLGVDSVRGARKTMKLWAKDVDHTATGGAIDMMFAGGSFLGGYIHGTDPAETARSIRAALRKRGFTQAMQDGFMDTVVDTSAKYWDKYREIGDAIENASREATYEASTKAGKSKAQAVFDAKDLMDYSMQGQWALFQFLGDTVPFFNARLQGLYKLKRAGAVPGWGSKGKVIMRGGMIAAASLALLALNWGDDRYEELEDWDKDIYWHFWIGDQHLRIPKPFEIGVIFGTIPERMARLFGGKDDHRKAVKQLWWNFVETFNLVGMPQMIAPTMEVYANRDSFTKRDIEGMADEGKLKSARYNEGTSETMRAIGSAVSDTINLSPKQLEHLWNGYLGTLGMYVLGASDMVVRVATDKPEAPSWRLDDYPVLKSFARSAPAKSTRYKTELYEMLRESEQVYRTIKDKQKQGLAEDAKDIAADNQGKLKARGALKSAATRLKALRQQVDHVYRDRSLTAAQKRERVDKLMERGNILARRAVEKTHPIFNQ